MKYFYLFVLLISSQSTFSQTDYPPYFGEESRRTLDVIRTHSDSWGVIRNMTFVGYFLSITGYEAAAEAHEMGEHAELFTESVQAIPTNQRATVVNDINLLIIENEMSDPKFLNENETAFWNNLLSMVEKGDVERAVGSSHGEPHIESFDGYKYDFQTVGEFTLCKSSRFDFEIQSRQKKLGPSVSANSAVAMNVHGNKVGVYADEFPDSSKSTLYINGKGIEKGDKTIRLARGGLIKIKNSKITVYWEGGEFALIQLYKAPKPYLNILVNIVRSKYIHYTGLLGNANGIPGDDLKTRDGIPVAAGSWAKEMTDYVNTGKIASGVRTAEKLFSEQLSKKFADSWRVTDSNSLFTYASSKNTRSFTDKKFPKKYLSLSDLSSEDIQNAKKTCEAANVTQGNMRSCIYDVAFTNESLFAQSTIQLEQAVNTMDSFGVKLPGSTEILKKGNNVKNIIKKIFR